MRIEKDFIGQVELPNEVLYGIHSIRAKKNFPDTSPFHIEWYKAVGKVKLAIYITYKNFKKNILLEYKPSQIPFILFDDNLIEALIKSAEEVSIGKHFEHFITPAVQGGAGTSINMNINEIISNRALIEIGKNPGMYDLIDPIEHANIYQSTNDVIPTSIKIAIIDLLNELELNINKSRKHTEELESKYRNTLRIAYTQMQEAVPSTYGRLFGTYSDALSRDWWRVSKCFERIKMVNLGGSAIGTGITVPRFFIMEAAQQLQKITSLPIARSENMCDATCNTDVFVEIHAILKAHAVTLNKIASDLRLLSSDIVNKKEITIPQKQVGSSIMPGKVNPVISEFIISASHTVFSNDVLITELCSKGTLDLNAYIPTIGHALISSIKLLIASNKTLAENILSGIEINTEIAKEKLFNSASITTALLPYIGYNKAAELAKLMKKEDINIFDANKKLGIINEKKLIEVLETNNLLKEGFSIKDL